MFPVRFYLDYIDPGSFLMDRTLGLLEEAGVVAVERIPWEVRRPPEPMLEADDPAWTAYWEEMAGRAGAAGLELVRPRLVPWTRKAHELGLLARAKGCFDNVHRDLMDRFHLEGRDVGRVDVLVARAGDHGLDRSEAKAVLDVDRHAEALDRIRVEAMEAGIRGVPTLGHGDRYLEGVHDLNAVQEFLESKQASEEED